jgi:hypothetical protein
MRRILFLLASLVLAVAVVGCGSGKLHTKGRLLMDGKPLAVSEEDTVRVIFVPVPEPGKRPENTYMAAFHPEDGTFTAVGADGKGLPPGKYRIAVEYTKKKRDMLKGAFDSGKSPFVYDIDQSTGELTLDLSKPKG